MFESVRVLIALQAEVAAMRKLAALQRTLQSSPAIPKLAVAWTSAANLRIPLRALRPIDPALTPALLAPLRDLASPLPPLRLQLGPLSAFPAPDRARLITVDVADPGAVLKDLIARLDALLDSLGCVVETGPFVPHLTLARLPEPCDAQQWLASVEPISLETRITECSLHSHTQLRTGGEHVAIDRFPLAHQPQRSQRPSKAPKPSQRPSRKPPRSPEPGTARDEIPAAPRVPSIPVPGATPEPQLPQPQAGTGTAPEPPARESLSSQSSSILPPAPPRDDLPPEDDWGV